MAENQTAEWCGQDLSNEAHYTKTIKKIEFLIRKSFQYDIWQKRSKIGVKKCPICNEDLYYLKPESHHYPETLFDLVDNCLQDHIQKNDLDELDEFDISQEIMHKHKMNQVSYVVLCKQCHQKYHEDVPSVVDAMPEAIKKQKEELNIYFNKDISKGANNG